MSPNHAKRLPKSLYEAVARRYSIKKVLGEGASSVVFLVTQITSERPLVLKLFLDSFADETLRMRFSRECKSLEQLDHKNIVKLIEWGELDCFPYLALQYCEAKTLTTALKMGDFSSSLECVKFGRGCAEALALAHSKGIIHRDVKPDNILVTNDHRPLVIDFGLARSELMRTYATKTGVILGTPAYMAPECLRGEVATEAADVYSLGLVLYQMLSGCLPFTGSLLEIIDAKFNSIPPRLIDVCPRAGKRLSELIGGTLLPLTERRPCSCFELEKQLSKLADSIGETLKAKTVVNSRIKSESQTSIATIAVALSVAVLPVVALQMILLNRDIRDDTVQRLTLKSASPSRRLRDEAAKMLRKNTVPTPQEARKLGLLVIAAQEYGVLKDNYIPGAIGLEHGIRILLKRKAIPKIVDWWVALIARHWSQVSPKVIFDLFNELKHDLHQIVPLEKRFRLFKTIVQTFERTLVQRSSKEWQRVATYCAVTHGHELPFEKGRFNSQLKQLEAMLSDDGDIVSKLRFNALYLKCLQRQLNKERLTLVRNTVASLRELFSNDPNGAIEVLKSAAECFGELENQFALIGKNADQSIEYIQEAQEYTSSKQELACLKLLECSYLRSAAKPREAYFLLRELVHEALPKQEKAIYMLEATRVCRQLGKFDEAMKYLKEAEKTVTPEQLEYLLRTRRRLLLSINLNKSK